MTAYVIFHGEVFDAERYEDYKAAVAPSIAAAGGRYLVRGGDPVVLEGETPTTRLVILEFPSRPAAIGWYQSADYTEIRKLRETAARATLLVVDGLD